MPEADRKDRGKDADTLPGTSCTDGKSPSPEGKASFGNTMTPEYHGQVSVGPVNQQLHPLTVYRIMAAELLNAAAPTPATIIKTYQITMMITEIRAPIPAALDVFGLVSFHTR